MAKPYSKLRHAMDDADIDREAICKVLDKSTTYVAQRLQCKYSWTVEGAYRILNMLGVPDAQMVEYFPNEKIKGRRVQRRGF